MYKYILFDLDGTLTDSAQGIYNSIEYTLRHYNICLEDKSILKAFIGPPLHESFKAVLGFDDEKSNEAVGVYREYFAKVGLFENQVYPQVYECLERLKAAGKLLAVATSKPEVFAKRILEHFDLMKYFDFVAAATLDKVRDKKSDIIAYAISNLGIENLSEVVMVGDRKHDIIGAFENGIDSIGVLYGYGSKEELASASATFTTASISATHLAPSPLDILKFVL